tara:strand:+ start:38792 stop:39574 length:783 start_codon:yes stop_codon:yes gene_type:complete
MLMHDDTAYTTKVATVKDIIKWCEHEDIKPGKWLVASKKYRFSREAINKIRDAYLVVMAKDIFADFSEDTHQSASFKSADEKQGKIKPTDHLILVALNNNACFDGFQQAFYKSGQVNVELDLGELDFTGYDSLVIIENRDSFNDWHLFQTQIACELGTVLAIYRGDSHYSVAATKLLKHWRLSRHERPVIYFGDFDLAGLRIAVSSQCSHLLLPPLNWLKTNLISQHYPEEQQKFLGGGSKTAPKFGSLYCNSWLPKEQV